MENFKKYLKSRFRHLLVITMVLFLMLFVKDTLVAQVSGGWDSFGTVGTTGYTNHGSGVIQLLNNPVGCAGAAVHETSDVYDHNSAAVFNKCFKAFFGCPSPGSDDIGTDVHGDGMAFSFYKNNCTWTIGTCGGGLGYDAAGCANKILTIEFDTYSSYGTGGFDANYGGGTTGTSDEIALHRDANASDVGRITSSNAGNLEDGLEHDVCISYDPATDILSVTIDGAPMFSYDLTGSPYDLPTYFGAGGALRYAWSSGSNGAKNPATISDGAGIQSTIGTTLCPASVTITSPSSGASFIDCPVAPITITAEPLPPFGNTTNYVEFFVDGVSIGTDNTDPYAAVYNSPTVGAHTLTAVAHWSSGGTTSSSGVPITIGGGIALTSTAPTINGTIDALWGSYNTYNIGIGAGGADISGYFKIIYDNTNLYILVDVTDDFKFDAPTNCQWTGDKIELYIDIGNDNLTTWGAASDFEYGFNYNDLVIPGDICVRAGTSKTGVNFSMNTSLPTGYITEISIPWTTLGLAGPPAAGSFMGIEVQVADGDDANEGTREGKIRWSDNADITWNNPSAMGTLAFSDCNPLPTGLLQLEGNLTNGSVFLNWVSILENQNQYYILQKSTDLNNWNQIDKMYGNGIEKGLIELNYTDVNVETNLVYYRIVQVNPNGSMAYSNIISIITGGRDVLIYPNPFQHEIFINTMAKGIQKVVLFDMLGKQVNEYFMEPTNGVITLNPQLASGNYIITISNESNYYQEKIIKF